MEADQDKIIEAVRAIGKALEEHEVPELEGMIALRALLEAKQKQAGYEVGMTDNLVS